LGGNTGGRSELAVLKTTVDIEIVETDNQPVLDIGKDAVKRSERIWSVGHNYIVTKRKSKYLKNFPSEVPSIGGWG
jgi:hypothetical protein